jgi:hypothetical protein
MSLEDRLTYGEGPLGGLPPEPEQEPEPEETGRPNRAFIFIAIAMGGLILLGILALIGALAFIVPQRKAQQIAAVTQTVDAMTQVAANWTPTFTPEPTMPLPTYTSTVRPTQTPIPTATATRVVNDVGGEAATVPTATTQTTSQEWGATTPSAGLGSFGIVSIAVGLAGLIFAVRGLRLRR